MTKIQIKRVYEAPSTDDGYRVLVDRMWPRGVKKEKLRYYLWAKAVAPSPELREWFHADPDHRWSEFAKRYLNELKESDTAAAFARGLQGKKAVTLLYASKNTTENNALILQKYLQKVL